MTYEHELLFYETKIQLHDNFTLMLINFVSSIYNFAKHTSVYTIVEVHTYR